MRFIERPQVAALLGRTGALRALEGIPRAPGLVVLNYHRIGAPAANDFDDGTFSATPEAFRHQVAYLKRRFAMPPVHEILESCARQRFDEPTALVTFDDGYRDNHEQAFRILRDLDVAACFFVVSSFLDHPVVPWWDRIAYSVKKTEVEVLCLDYPEHLRFDLRTTPRSRATWRILRAYKDARGLDEGRFLDELARRTRVEVDVERLGRTLFMSWDAARDMHRAGMAIGSHTATHQVLASLSEDAQRRELVGSRERIGHELGVKPDMLAYPVGGPTSFTGVTRRLVREAGYRVAFRYYGGLNRPGDVDLFAISRLAVDYGDTWPQFRVRTTTCALGLRA